MKMANISKIIKGVFICNINYFTDICLLKFIIMDNLYNNIIFSIGEYFHFFSLSAYEVKKCVIL